MLSVLVANPKGGCGKTTVATHLAAAFAKSGFATALADCDRQRSSIGWAARRPTAAPPVFALDWTKKVGKLPDGIRRLVIDAPAATRRKEVRELIRNAHVIVVPVLPSPFDEATTGYFLDALEDLKPIRNNKRALAVIGNRVRARTAAAQRLDDFLAGLKRDAVARLRDSQAYPQAAMAGLSVFDVATRRVQPLIEDWQPLLRFIADAAGERRR